MIVDPALADVDPLRQAIRDNVRADESGIVAHLGSALSHVAVPASRRYPPHNN